MHCPAAESEYITGCCQKVLSNNPIYSVSYQTAAVRPPIQRQTTPSCEIQNVADGHKVQSGQETCDHLTCSPLTLAYTPADDLQLWKQSVKGTIMLQYGGGGACDDDNICTHYCSL